jgi:hypothetical protein
MSNMQHSNSDDPSVNSDSDDSSVEEDAESLMRQALSKTIMDIEWHEDGDGIFSDVDAFLELSKGNNIVQVVQLNPYWSRNRIRRSDAVEWEEKLGMALGNLQSLTVLSVICTDERDDDESEEEREPPNWECVGRVLRHVWQKITLSVQIRPTRGSEEAFARAIRGHPTIQRFETSNTFHIDSFGILASALATLPALESTVLLHEQLYGDDLEDLHAMEHPEHITTLLLSPSLRSVEFEHFNFPHSVCQAVALALKTGSPITCLKLMYCDFPEGGGGSIVHALQRNSTLKTLSLAFNEIDDGIRDALTSVLRVNTTLTDLTLYIPRQFGSSTWLQAFFVAVRMNTSLKKLNVDCLPLSDELGCEALRGVLAKNSVLEELTLHFDRGYPYSSPLINTDVASWRRTLPFLRDNKTLKLLVIDLNGGTLEPHVATLCIDTVAMLEDNISLEVLDIKSRGFSLSNYFTALESLQKNTTLKTLRLYPNPNLISEDGELKHLISLVKKNYGLEYLDEDLSYRYHDTTGELDTILRLNQAGRRYLIEDAGSIAKGVEVLVAMRDNLSYLFYHLLENPLLCDLEHRYVTTGTIDAVGPVHSNKRPRTY